jgi:4-hydroxymandelate synthase
MGRMSSESTPFADLQVDHVEFHVDDLVAAAAQFGGGYGLQTYASKPGSVILGRGGIRIVLTVPEDEAGRSYVERHGDGVASIGLRVPDAGAAFAEAVRRGATAIAPPVTEGAVTTASVLGFGDVRHKFVQRTGDERVPAGYTPGMAPVWDSGLREVDHFAVCLEAGQLEPTVAFYERVLDFDMTFTEKIVVGAQAMNSQVVQSKSRAVTLTLIEPDVSRAAGQIDAFLAAHGGAGVQHIAFTTENIVRTVGAIGARGVGFLETPDAYYRRLPGRLDVERHAVDDLRRLNVLVDEDHDGQLFQIFSRSTHPRNTFFVEVIERLGARTFGSGNIKALYEAVELQRGSEEAAA